MKICYLLALLLFPLLTIAQDVNTTLIDMCDDGRGWVYPLIHPIYPKGGPDGLSKWCMERTVYSQNMADSGIFGRVYFLVAFDSLGKLIDAKYLKRETVFDDPILVKESIRLISNFPRFTPGKRKGKNVSCEFIFGLFYLPHTILNRSYPFMIPIYPRQDLKKGVSK